MIMLLEKMLQSQGFGSRKHCQQLIKNGVVKVDNQSIDLPKYKVDIHQLKFSVHGQEYQYREKVYIALNKPKNYECSHQATHHFSVFDFFDDILMNRGIQCVGRLDQDTTGLILLTDDGQFLQALTHPKKHVPKVYKIDAIDVVTQEHVQQLELGVELRNESGVFAATEVQKISEHALVMTIHQGVYHQVKRMIAAVGNKVETLHRQQVGQLRLETLAEGEWIYLNESQIAAARNMTDVELSAI